MPPTRKRLFRILSVLIALCIIAGLAFSFFVGRKLTAPVPRTVGPPPTDLHAQTVHFPSKSGTTIAGWLAEVPDARGSVLLLHAFHGDRRDMTDRARFLNRSGYNTLAIDFQAHGESPGNHITLGHLEAMDAAAGVTWLQNRDPDLPVAVIGTSLGAASALMANYGKPPQAIVAESSFADIKTAIDNRMKMRFGPPGPVLSPLLSGQFKLFLGFDANSLSPLHAIANLRVPLFLLSGSEDPRATPAETRALYDAAPGPKEIWKVPGATHVDLHRYATKDYEKKVAAFLALHLRSRSLR